MAKGKYTINAGVRETIALLDEAMLECDEIEQCMASGGMSESLTTEAGLRRQRAKARIVGLAARLVSHATKGERYPHMTDGHYGPRQW